MGWLIHNLQIQKCNSTYVSNYNIAGVNKSSQNFESAIEEQCGVLNNSYYGNKVYDTRNFESMAYIYFPKPIDVDLTKKKILEAKLIMKTTSQLESGFEQDGTTIYQVNAQYFVANANICGSDTNTSTDINYLNKSDMVSAVGSGGWLKSNFNNVGSVISPSIASTYLDNVRQGFEYDFLIIQMYAAYYKPVMVTNYWPYFSKTKDHILDIYYEDVIPDVDTEFPVGINIKNTIEHTFTWGYTESVNVGQKSFDIDWSTDGDTWNTNHVDSSNHYYTFAANTFSAGSIQWRIRATNTDGQVSEWSYATFNAIGVTDAPDNISVTNDAKPDITWTVDNQDAFEIEIIESGERIYESGMMIGSDLRSFKLPFVLENGNYIVSIRALNQFGIYTSWASASFVINKAAPSIPEAFISYTDDFAVSVKSNDSAELYVLRKKTSDSKYEILASLDKEFKDIQCLNGQSYDYAVRKYADGGIVDSKSVTMSVGYSGLLIYCKDIFVRIWLTTDTDMFLKMRLALSRQTNHPYVVGKEYPIRETNRWKSCSYDLSAYISKEDYETLERIYSENEVVYIKYDITGFSADIVSLNIVNAFFNQGYDIDIAFTRVDSGG